MIQSTKEWRVIFSRLRPTEWSALERLAENEGRSVSGQIRMMLRQQLIDETRNRRQTLEQGSRSDEEGAVRKAATREGRHGGGR